MCSFRYGYPQGGPNYILCPGPQNSSRGPAPKEDLEMMKIFKTVCIEKIMSLQGKEGRNLVKREKEWNDQVCLFWLRIKTRCESLGSGKTVERWEVWKSLRGRMGCETEFVNFAKTFGLVQANFASILLRKRICVHNVTVNMSFAQCSMQANFASTCRPNLGKEVLSCQHQFHDQCDHQESIYSFGEKSLRCVK